MRRREAVALLGCTAAWPLDALAQQAERMARVGVLMGIAADDPEMPGRISTLTRALEQRGWIEGRNLKIDYRWAGGDAARARQYAAELLASKPDLILAGGPLTAGTLQQATNTVPIIFVAVVDPVGAGYVASLARPGGNATGFITFEYGVSAKWLELLKEIAPSVTRAGVLRDPVNPAAGGQLGAIQATATTLGIEISPLGVRDAGEIERGIAAFARVPNGGLIVTSGALTFVHRKTIIAQAARHRLPAVYHRRLYVTDGGLISYGPDLLDQYTRAAGYADRILKGEKPA